MNRQIKRAAVLLVVAFLLVIICYVIASKIANCIGHHMASEAYCASYPQIKVED